MMMKCVLLLVVVFALCGAAIAEPNAETIPAFAKWIQQQKVHSKFNLGTFENAGLGGIAREDIKENATLILVPKSALVYNDVVAKESFLKEFNEWSGVLSVEPLVAWIMSESTNPESSHKAFLDMLPGSYPTHTLSWTDEELAELAGTGLDTTTTAIKQVLERVFNHLSDKLVPRMPNRFPNWSFDRFIWAYQSVNTRSWAVTDDEGNKHTIMVPLADMLNHKPGAGTGGITFDGQHFIINATQDYAAGEQVFDNYGYKSNYDLLSTYGFVLESNEYDNMKLEFALKPSNLVHSIVEPLLKSVDPNYQSIQIRNSRLPLELMRVFRLSVMTFSELEFVGAALEGKGVSLSNELKAFREGINALTTMLQSFPTSLDQDKQLLESTELSVNQRNAIIMRKGQKEILVNNIVLFGKLWENILLTGELLGGIPV